MKTDLLLLTLLYAVSFTAFIGAINSRGPARVALSYFLAILTLCGAVFHTTQLMAGPSTPPPAEEAVVVTPPPPASPTQPGAPPQVQDTNPAPLPPAVDSSLAASNDQMAVAATKNELKGILDASRRISRSLGSLNLGGVADVSDEEYETLQNKTIGFLTEARRTKDKLAPIAARTPESIKPVVDSLSKGIETLVTAAYNAERFFKSENDAEEKAHLAAYKRGSQAANALFKKVGTEIGSEDSGE